MGLLQRSATFKNACQLLDEAMLDMVTHTGKEELKGMKDLVRGVLGIETV